MNIFRRVEDLIVNLVASNNLAAVETLIASIPGVSGMLYENHVPLIHAAVNFNFEMHSREKINEGKQKINVNYQILEALLNDGADLTEQSPYGSFAYRIIRSNDLDFINWMFQSNRLTPETPISNDDRTSLHAAGFNGCPDVYEAIKPYCSNPEVNDTQGCPPLAFLLLHSLNSNADDIERIIDMFEKMGANINPMIMTTYLPEDQRFMVPLSYELAISAYRYSKDKQIYNRRKSLIHNYSNKSCLAENGMTEKDFINLCQNNTIPAL